MRGLFLVQIFKLSFVIIGTFVGAGFASGKEIYLFFYRYGLYGLLGIIISCLVICFVIYKVMSITVEENIKSYNSFFDFIIKSKKIKLVLKNIINIFLILSFCVMVSGFSSFFKQEFNINNFFSYLFLILISICVFYKDIGVIEKINNIIVPVITCTIIYCFIVLVLYSDNNHSWLNITNCNNRFLRNAILYANYNLLSIVPICVSISKDILNKKSIKIICIISCLSIILLSVSIFFILNTSNFSTWQLDMPIVAIIGSLGKAYKYLYCCIIACAIITTAISVGYSYLQQFRMNRFCYNYHIMILVIATIISSQFSFSRLVELLYPIFGCIGLFQSYFILCKANGTHNIKLFFKRFYIDFKK